MLRDINDHELWADRAEELADVAKEVLRGRNATVFEGRVIAPLRGDPKRSVEELAAQFGVSPAKIHKITERAKDRVLEVFRQRMTPKTEGDKCPTCGRVYADGTLANAVATMGLSGINTWPLVAISLV